MPHPTLPFQRWLRAKITIMQTFMTMYKTYCRLFFCSLPHAKISASAQWIHSRFLVERGELLLLLLLHRLKGYFHSTTLTVSFRTGFECDRQKSDRDGFTPPTAAPPRFIPLVPAIAWVVRLLAAAFILPATLAAASAAAHPELSGR
jgi:hypothetical protein